MAKIKSDYNWDGTQNYDWLDAITRTGYYQDYNISFSGGNGKTRYYASLGYLNQEGVAINSDMKRYSARLNLETSYKWFNFGFNTSFALADMDAFSQSTGGSYSNPFVSATLKATPLDPFTTKMEVIIQAFHTTHWLFTIKRPEIFIIPKLPQSI